MSPRRSPSKRSQKALVTKVPDVEFSDALIKKDEKKDEEPKPVASFAELFSFATCLDRFLILLCIIAAMAHGASWPLLFLIFGDMTNNFIGFQNNSLLNITNATFNGTSLGDFEDTMTEFALKYIYIGLGVCAATYIHIAFFQISCERQTHKLRKAFFKALLRENIGWYDKHQSGELTTRLAE